MQNLSFIPPSQAVKPVEEPAKSNIVTGQTSQNASHNPDDSSAQKSFQNLLNKQFQAKRLQENTAAKSANKIIVKPDNTQKNLQVDALGKEDDSLNSVNGTNIEDLVARLKEHQLRGEDLTSDDETSESDEEAKMLNAIAETASQLQYQGSVDLAMLRAHLQPSSTNSVTEKLENQSYSDEGLSKDLMTSSLEDALFKSRTQLLQSDQITGNEHQWKSDFSEKTSEGFGEEIVKDAASLNALQIQTAPQTMTNQSSQVASQLGSSNQILAYPGRSGWNQEVSQKVVWMVGAGEQSATLTLNPPDLGPLQVVISVNNSNADASFFSDNPEVRQALEDGLEHLRESMQSSGLQLGQTSVNAGQQQSQQNFQEMAHNQFSNNLKSQQGLMDKELPAMGISVRESQGLVDTFA